MRIIKKTLLAIALANLVGCAAMQTTLEHKDLQVSTQLSETLYLDEVQKQNKVVHLSVKNTSDQDVEISGMLKKAIEGHGYKVTNNPDRAHYLLQANILKVGKMSVSASREALGQGYGSVITGVGSAAVVGAAGGSGNAMLGAGLVMGLADMAASSLVKDVNYAIITDVQVSERVEHQVSEASQSNLKNGANSQTVQKSKTKSNFQRYRTRVVSSADKVNLKFDEAKPEIEKGLVRVLAGIF